jgi:hypothetical protein
MTEQEAMTKECPHFSTAVAVLLAAEKEKNFECTLNTKCLGSACMMWRDTLNPTVQYRDGVPHGLSFEHMGGYCGLASRELA